MTAVPHVLVVEPESAGQRLDVFLTSHLENTSRARVQQLISQGKVLVNRRQEKASFKLRGSEQIEIMDEVTRKPLRAIAEEIPLEIVYEDKDLAVINKPAGMMVHAGAGATEDARNRGTLVNALLHRFGRVSTGTDVLRPGIVHRLDKQTSGLVVIAKSDRAHRLLAEQFAARKVHKTYVALVHGWLKEDAGTINLPVGRDEKHRTRMTSGRGRSAVTHYRVLQRVEGRLGKFTVAEVKIETGRTHQIRVQLSSSGHPVVGDTLYGAPDRLRGKRATAATIGRNFLHAAGIEFLHPETHTSLHLQAALPAEPE